MQCVDLPCFYWQIKWLFSDKIYLIQLYIWESVEVATVLWQFLLRVNDTEYQTIYEFWGKKICQERKDKQIVEAYGQGFSKFLLQDEQWRKNCTEDSGTT